VHPQNLQAKGKAANHEQEPEGLGLPRFDGLAVQ
jgi:hypothetical protein